MRSSGYMFALKDCLWAVMKVNGGNFTCFIPDRAEATAVVRTAYLTVEVHLTKSIQISFSTLELIIQIPDKLIMYGLYTSSYNGDA